MTPIRIKFLSRADPREWTRYFPGEDGVWGECAFFFGRAERDYDWLVVYDDLPPTDGADRAAARESLRCPAANTILVTTEPESIKAYGRAFAAQFGHVVTSQPEWALPHPNRHHQQAANHWFYGSGRGRWLSHADMRAGAPPGGKTEVISVVHSIKRQRHTLHARRHAFIESLRDRIPEMAVFGRGFAPLDDKAEALAPFRYHLAVENHLGPHHITEKLTDALLGRCLAFYAGAPNAADSVPAGSFVPIDIRDPEGTARTIRDAIESNLWSRRLPDIEEGRRRVLEEHHLFAVTARIVAESTTRGSTDTGRAARPNHLTELHGRHAWRRAHPLAALAHVIEKARIRARAIREQRLRTARGIKPGPSG